MTGYDRALLAHALIHHERVDNDRCLCGYRYPLGTRYTDHVLDEYETAAAVPSGMLWRTGRKVGRTIYARRGAAPSDDDPLIGVMDTPELAAEAVRAHNSALLDRAFDPGRQDNA